MVGPFIFYFNVVFLELLKVSSISGVSMLPFTQQGLMSLLKEVSKK